ncbi:MAG: hypothetical protein SWH54_09790 [Thermodesulfobacteriota bacterium]|nr:hypothetical protein [Thermodesulfobacteriota bacterium]
MLKRKICMSFFVCLFFCSAGFAEPLYMWEDKDKVIHVSDVKPNHKNYITIYSPYGRAGKDTNTKASSEKTVRAQQVKPQIALNLNDIIKNNCQKEWPNDYRMQKFCIDQQKDALKKLRAGRPADIPKDIFIKIRNKCSRKWKNDFRMVLFCERQECEAWRQLNR